jgi:hypothetical protein
MCLILHPLVMLEVVIVLNFCFLIVCLMFGRLGNLDTAHFLLLFLKLGSMVLTLSK